jgi:hypothetical protein
LAGFEDYSLCFYASAGAGELTHANVYCVEVCRLHACVRACVDVGWQYACSLGNPVGVIRCSRDSGLRVQPAWPCPVGVKFQQFGEEAVGVATSKGMSDFSVGKEGKGLCQALQRQHAISG